MTRTLVALSLSLAVATPAAAQKVTVPAAQAARANVVVTAPLPAGAPEANAVTLPDGLHAAAQVTADGKALVFVLPAVKAGVAVAVTPTTLHYVQAPPQFKFAAEKDGTTDLLFDGRRVLQYFHPKHDPADHFYTFKPFHHVYDPAEGKTLLTNGSAKTAKDGLFPHHRGLFYAWNKISYDGKTADVWHGTKNVFAQHDKVLGEEAGQVFGRQRAAVSWHGEDGKAFATEQRELTAYAAPGGTLIDFASVLTTDRASVKLDGDPQHAGFHFRANMEVSKKEVAKETYYLRPDGKGKPGETRNWDAKGKNPTTINLPWNACSFVVGGKRYTVLRINHPDNPKDARGSERDYGRFGDYFEYELTPAKPLKVKYRVWVQEGEMTVEQAEAVARGFTEGAAGK